MTASGTLGERTDRNSWGPGLLESIWRFLWLVVALAVIGAVAGYWAVGRQPDRYRATARLHLSPQPRSGLFGENTKIDPARRLLDQAERITSRPILASAAELLPGKTTGAELGGSVDSSVSTDVDVLTVNATDRSPRRAAAIANAVVEAYEEHMMAGRAAATQTAIEKLNEYRGRLEASIADRDGQLEALRLAAAQEMAAAQGYVDARALEQQLKVDRRHRDLEARRNAAFTQLTAVQNRADQLAVDAASAPSDVELAEAASAPKAPAGTDATRGALLGGALGLLVGAALAWTLAERRQRNRGASPTDAILGMPCLAQVPDHRSMRGLPTRASPWSPSAEAFNFVVAALNPALAEPGRKTWLVTSPSPGDGKTTTTLNLAIAAQKRGYRVMVVDADLRGRGLTLRSGAADHRGLTDVAAGHVPLARCTLRLEEGSNGSSPLVVPTGELPEDPAVFFGSDGFWRALARLEHEVDVVLVDSPSLLMVADARAIAEQVTGTILVTTPGTSTEVLEATAQVLRWTSAPVLGFVLNRARRRARRDQKLALARPTRRSERNALRRTQPLDAVPAGRAS